jgi:hypothetical protein
MKNSNALSKNLSELNMPALMNAYLTIIHNDDEKVIDYSALGRLKVNVLPFPRTLSTRSFPLFFLINS